MSKTARELLFDLENKYDSSKVDANSVFNFIFSGEGAGEYTVAVQDGVCKVSEGLSDNAKCEVKTAAQTFVDVLSGKVNPTMAVMTGKLKVSNIGEMMKFAKPFGLM